MQNLRVPGKLGILCLSASLFFISCKKSPDNGNGNGNNQQDSITPPHENPTAASIGFFLDDWAEKTFQTPDFDITSKPNVTNVSVNIDASDVVTRVPKYLFGNNSNPYMTQVITEPTLLNNITSLSPNVIRFPGGNISSVYFWNADKNVPPADAPATLYDSDGNPSAAGYWYGKNSESWTLSVDNYYNMLQQTGNKGMITINYGYARYGTGPKPAETAAHLAADWVRYDHGRTKFWEIGNESNGPWQAGFKIDLNANQDGQSEIISGDLYGKHFKIFADSMRQAASEVGATIKIGAQLMQTDASNSWNVPDRTWNSGLFASAGDYPDFYIVHDYYTPFNENSSASTILATAASETKLIMDYMKTTTTAGHVTLKPIALTEWNIFAVGSKQMVSHIAGMHATMVLGELLKNQFGEASRWDLANGWSNGDDQGMFSQGDEPDNNTKWNPRPAFYHMYFFQKYFGDRMVASSVTGATDVVSYASTYSSGETGVVLVNTGTTEKNINVYIKNFREGDKYYWWTLTGGSDNGEFSRKVFVNGQGPTLPSGGPSNYQTVKARAATISGSINLNLPPRSSTFVVVESKK